MTATKLRCRSIRYSRILLSRSFLSAGLATTDTGVQSEQGNGVPAHLSARLAIVGTVAAAPARSASVLVKLHVTTGGYFSEARARRYLQNLVEVGLVVGGWCRQFGMLVKQHSER